MIKNPPESYRMQIDPLGIENREHEGCEETTRLEVGWGWIGVDLLNGR